MWGSILTQIICCFHFCMNPWKVGWFWSVFSKFKDMFDVDSLILLIFCSQICSWTQPKHPHKTPCSSLSVTESQFLQCPKLQKPDRGD